MVKLSAIGDVALFGDYTDLIINNGYDYPFASISKYINKSDVVFANLESPLSNEGRPDKSKPICVCGSPAGIASLIHAGITHVSLANNHSYDYGKNAILDTQRKLEEAGISFVGVGENLYQSRQPIIEKIPGGTLAILSYNSYATNGRCYASRLRGGVSPLKYKYIKFDIESIKQKYENSVILISLHWGVEGNNYPTPFQRDLARQIIEDGASLIIGHHSHVMQGIEQYGNGVIVYSLGNFCFPDVTSLHIEGMGYNQKRENRESFIFQCEIMPDGIGAYKTIPIFINDDLQPEMACGKRGSDILEQIDRYSKPFSNTNYRQIYRNEIRRNKRIHSSRLVNLVKREGISGIIKRLRLCYLRALIIGFYNSLREARHQYRFYKKRK